MPGVMLPDEYALPPGPRRDLTLALHKLYDKAGRPGVRPISASIEANDDLPGTVSREWVSRVLRGQPASWKVTSSLAQALIAMSRREQDVAGIVRWIHQLWIIADDAAAVPVVAVDQALDLAVRGVYGATATDAIDLVLRATLLVPRAGDKLVVAETHSKGRWLCVFSSTDRLKAHLASAGPDWPDRPDQWPPALGRDVVQEVHSLDPPVGLLVDPPDHALPLTPGLIAEVCGNL